MSLAALPCKFGDLSLGESFLAMDFAGGIYLASKLSRKANGSKESSIGATSANVLLSKLASAALGEFKSDEWNGFLCWMGDYCCFRMG